jgi:hypothetical protein
MCTVPPPAISPATVPVLFHLQHGAKYCPPASVAWMTAIGRNSARINESRLRPFRTGAEGACRRGRAGQVFPAHFPLGPITGLKRSEQPSRASSRGCRQRILPRPKTSGLQDIAAWAIGLADGKINQLTRLSSAARRSSNASPGANCLPMSRPEWSSAFSRQVTTPALHHARPILLLERAGGRNLHSTRSESEADPTQYAR